MKCLKSSYNLDEHIPDFLLLDIGLPLLIIADFLEYITIVSIFHNQTIKENKDVKI